jgi:hypothetical protein
MRTLKQTTLDVIRHLPDSCSLEEIMYEINLTAQVIEGLKDEEEKRTISTDDLLKRVAQWKQK